MPIYEYLCCECGRSFETIRSMKDADSPIQCTFCQSNETRRKLSVCYAQSDGHTIAGTHASGGCGNCSGGTCGSCGCGH